jgi:hypothetical protein
MPATFNPQRFERVTRRWLELAERRLVYYEDLYRSGRWRHYFPTQEHFAVRMLDVIKAAKAFRQAAGEAAPRREDSLRPAA